MTIYETRRARLLQLIEQRYAGTKAALASDMQWAATDVSRFFTKSKHGRNITEAKARDIETRLRLPKYWLDQNAADPLTVQSPLPIYAACTKKLDKLLELFDGLTDVQQDEIIEQIRGYHQANAVVLKQLGGKVQTLSNKRAAEKLPPAPKLNT